MAQQMAQRLAQISPVSAEDRPALLEGSRNMVRRMRARLGAWGENGVLDRAPKFPSLNLPATMKPHLSAMGRYQVCNWATMRQQGAEYEDESRRAGAIATTGITMAVFYLRKPFADKGGKIAEIEDYLTNEAMDREFQRVMKSPDLLTHIEEQCQPFVTEMFSPETK